MNNDFRFTATTYNGIIVTCSNAQWENHVVSEHPDMADAEEGVVNALEDPHVHGDSKTHANRQVFVRKGVSPQHHHSLFTRVIVEVAGNTGELITAFPTENPTGGIDFDKGTHAIRYKL